MAFEVPVMVTQTEPWLVPHIPDGIDVFIDVGAFKGYWTFYILKHKLKPTGRIIAIDPMPQYPLDRRDLDRRITLIRKAVHRDMGTIRLFMDEYQNHFLSDPKLVTEHGTRFEADIKCMSLDSLLGHSDIKIADNVLVKVDVEGAEVAVIDGATALIKQVRPKLIVECHPMKGPEPLARAKVICDTLSDLGYQCDLVKAPRDPEPYLCWAVCTPHATT